MPSPKPRKLASFHAFTHTYLLDALEAGVALKLQQGARGPAVGVCTLGHDLVRVPLERCDEDIEIHRRPTQTVSPGTLCAGRGARKRSTWRSRKVLARDRNASRHDRRVAKGSSKSTGAHTHCPVGLLDLRRGSALAADARSKVLSMPLPQHQAKAAKKAIACNR